MSANSLAIYVLIWPILSAGVLALLIVALWRDIRASRKSGEEMI
jgi:cytochrome oxidase assembly protein ShyY1